MSDRLEAIVYRQDAAIRTLIKRVDALEARLGVVSGKSDTATPVLTEAAQRRLARGATKGAGTSRCATCGGAKEPQRINSNRCRSCDSK